jgi:hypothetical protein
MLAGVVPLHHQGKRKSQARKIKRNRSSSRKLTNNLLLMEWLMLVVKNRK